MVPCNLYQEVFDGKVIISAGVLSQVHRLWAAIGRPELIKSPMERNQNQRIKYRDQIDSIIGEWTKTRKCDEISDLLKNADVPCTKSSL